MFAKMSVPKRIIIGYVIFFIILAVISGFVIIQNLLSLGNARVLSDNDDSSTTINEATNRFLNSRAGVRIILTSDDYPVERYNTAIKDLDDCILYLNQGIDFARIQKATQKEQYLRNALSSITRYREQVIAVHGLNQQKSASKASMGGLADNVINSLTHIMELESEIIKNQIRTENPALMNEFEKYENAHIETEFYEVRLAGTRFAFLDNMSAYSDLMTAFNNVESNLLEFGAASNSEIRASVDTAIEHIEIYKAIFADYHGILTQLGEYTSVLESLNNEAQTVLEQASLEASTALNSAVDGIYSGAQVSLIVVIALMVIAFILNIIIAIIIVSSIRRALNSSIEKLSEITFNVVAASDQLSNAATSLAEGGTRQAASIEETSATMNETASMVQMTTTNTRQATELAREAENATLEGVHKVEELIRFMGNLRESSAEINKIVSDITTISSQTNILALNASVESVRAGEAGRSFSVVAEEVRNLSQQSSAAASNTENIIKNNINLTRQAAENSSTVEQALRAISDSIKKVSQLLDEISTASEEQASGVKQINVAMSEMERVTQSTASVSQESAAAASDLSNQSRILEQVTGELKVLIDS